MSEWTQVRNRRTGYDLNRSKRRDSRTYVSRGNSERGGRGGPARAKEIFQQDRTVVLNDEVQKTEDALAKALESQFPESQRRACLPTRPGYGSQGDKVLLYANYFKLSTAAGCDLFRYNVEVSPKPPGRKIQQVFNLLLDEHFERNRINIASDFKSVLLSRNDLLQGKPEQVYSVRYKGEFEEEYPEKPDTSQVRVIFTGKVSISTLLDYLTSTSAHAVSTNKAEVLQTLGIILGHDPKASPNIVSITANKRFSLSENSVERFSLGAGLEVLRGYVASVRAATARLLLNCQVQYALFFQEGELDKIITAFRRERSPSVVKLESFLKKLRVQVTHIRRQGSRGEDIPRFKLISGLASPSDGRSLPRPPIVPTHGAGPREVQFWLDETIGKKKDTDKTGARCGPDGPGRYLTVEEFFFQKYGITVNPDIPVVKVSTRSNPSYLPAEVCVVMAGQPTSAHLNGVQTQRLLRFAMRNPAENARSIVTKGAEMYGIGPQASTTLQTFGLHIEPELIVVPGRVLPCPSVFYKGNSKADVTSASWSLKTESLSRPSRLSSWSFLYIVSARDREHFRKPADLLRCLSALRAKLQDLGVMAPPVTDGQRVDVTSAFGHGKYNGVKLDQSIGAAITRMVKVELVLVVLPSRDAEIYSSVKRVCDVRLGVHNICVLGDKFINRDDQYLASVCLKINLKLGGLNQVLETNKLGIVSQGKTMVVGVDVTHPSPGSAADAPSVAGMVASIDRDLGQWPADIQIQESRQELVAPLDTMLRSRLELWAAFNNKQLPENIIVYRDGVSDGEHRLVVEREIPLLKSACEAIYPPSSVRDGFPRLSVIIVGKRHHTRFYPTREADADKLSSPRNGTVVDRGVTDAREWDFFLQAHTTLRGTARPAHYYIVWDEIFRKQKPEPPFMNAADILEDLTHNLCYLFGRATKAVSICPPAYYADLVCARARCYLKDVFDASPYPNASGKKLESNETGVLGKFSNLRVHQNLRNTMFYM